MNAHTNKVSKDDFIRQERDGNKILVPKDVQLFLPLDDIFPNKPRQAELIHNSIVHKSKFLTYSSTGYSEAEQNFMTLVLSNISENDDELPDLFFKIAEIAEFLGMKKTSIYEKIHKTVENLGKVAYEFPFEFEGELGYAVMPFFSLITHLDGKVLCKINPFLKPFLLPKKLWQTAGKKLYTDVNQKQEVTKYRAKNHIFLKGKHTKRIYEILITEAYKDFPFQISLKELKNILCVGDKYLQFREFTRCVLSPAEKEINGKSNIYFRYETIKSNQKVTDLVFHIFQKHENAGIKKIQEELDFYGISEESINYIINILEIKAEQIQANIHLLKQSIKKNKVDDPASWLYCAITRNYAEKSKEQLKVEEKINKEVKKQQGRNELIRNINSKKNKLTESINLQVSQYVLSHDKQEIITDFLENSKRPYAVKMFNTANTDNMTPSEIFSSPALFPLIRRFIIEKLNIENDLLKYIHSKGIEVTGLFLDENMIARRC